jgi:hypothetical protein
MKKILCSLIVLALFATTVVAQEYPITRRIQQDVTTTGEVASIGLATGTGTVDAFSNVSLTVYGVGGSPTAWNVTAEGSIDCDKDKTGNYSTMLTHDNTNDSEGDIESSAGTLAVCLKITVNSLTLGPATSLRVVVVGQE